MPTGGDLPSAPKPSGEGGNAAPEGKAPCFTIHALKDVRNANLDPVQIIKGWTDAAGELHGRIYDDAVSDGRKIGEDGHCREPVKSTVSIEDASFSNSVGDPALSACWQNPDFDHKQRGFHYVRVPEIPTPRWTTYVAKVYGVQLPEEVPAFTQERTYSSPIWYNP